MKSLLSILVLLCVTTNSLAQPKRVDAEKIKALIQDLGAGQFALRERATERLLKIGVAGLKELESATKEFSDKEIKLRASRILQIIRARDLVAKLKSFRAGKLSGDELAGWKPFRKLAGDSPRSRRLFVQMQEAQPILFRLLRDGNARKTQEELDRAAARASTRSQFGDTVAMGRVAALLFIAGEPKIKLDTTTSLVLSNLCFLPSFSSTLEGGPKESILRQLISRVLLRSTSDPANSYWLMVALDNNIPSALKSALRILGRKPTVGSSQYALLALAKFGKREHIKVAEKFAKDARRIRRRSVRINGKLQIVETQILDLAMAVVLHMEKRDLTKFGYGKTGLRHTTRVLDVNAIGFDSKQLRQRALALFASRKK